MGFELADFLCEQFNKFINTLKKERKQETQEKYPWLDPSDERKYMSDREILQKYIDLENSCLTDKGRKEVMDMLYKYKEAFSLRDEIGTCPNIGVEIAIMDKSSFFIRPYHVKEEDKNFIDKEMKCLCHLGILTLNVPHANIVLLSHLVKKVPLQEPVSAQSLA